MRHRESGAEIVDRLRVGFRVRRTADDGRAATQAGSLRANAAATLGLLSECTSPRSRSTHFAFDLRQLTLRDDDDVMMDDLVVQSVRALQRWRPHLCLAR